MGARLAGAGEISEQVVHELKNEDAVTALKALQHEIAVISLIGTDFEKLDQPTRERLLEWTIDRYSKRRWFWKPVEPT